MEAIVKKSTEIAFTDLGNGVKRKVLAYLPEAMMVEVHFEKNSEGSIHTHPHVQSTYVKKGLFRFTIDGETVEVSEGDTLAFPPGIPHGTVCLESGILLDIFTPMRKDFITD